MLGFFEMELKGIPSPLHVLRPSLLRRALLVNAEASFARKQLRSSNLKWDHEPWTGGVLKGASASEYVCDAYRLQDKTATFKTLPGADTFVPMAIAGASLLRLSSLDSMRKTSFKPRQKLS